MEREARAERERDALRRDLVAAEARVAQAERERDEARAETEKTREIWAGMLARECPFCSGGSDV